jgi:hypothetical protein
MSAPNMMAYARDKSCFCTEVTVVFDVITGINSITFHILLVSLASPSVVRDIEHLSQLHVPTLKDTGTDGHD